MEVICVNYLLKPRPLHVGAGSGDAISHPSEPHAMTPAQRGDGVDQTDRVLFVLKGDVPSAVDLL